MKFMYLITLDSRNFTFQSKHIMKGEDNFANMKEKFTNMEEHFTFMEEHSKNHVFAMFFAFLG